MRFNFLISLVLVLTVIVSALLVPGALCQPSGYVKPDKARLTEHIAHLSSFKTRFTGYPDFYSAARYIASEFKSMGLQVEEHKYPLLVPIDRGSYISVGGKRVPCYAVYPNGLSSQPRDISGRLVYVGRGELKDFDGKDVSGAIVVMDARSGSNWVNALLLGAKAVVFVGDFGSNLEAFNKFTTRVPVDFPRVYVPPPYASSVVKAAERGEHAVLHYAMKWERVQGVNVVAVLRGSERPEQAILVMAYFDSWSVTPALSPGVDQACSVAALLELARVISEHKPKVTFYFIAVSGHWEGLSGARYLLEQLYFNNTNLGRGFKPYVAVSLDLSSGSSKVYPVGAGFFYFLAHYNYFDTKYGGLRHFLDRAIAQFRRDYPSVYSQVATSELEQLEGYDFDSWYKVITTPFILDGEAAQLAGTPLLGFITNHDARKQWFTPDDKSVNVDNLYLQLLLISYILERLGDEDLSSAIGPWEDFAPTRRYAASGGGWGAAKLVVQVVEYDPRVGTLYRPIPNTVVTLYKVSSSWLSWTLAGVPYVIAEYFFFSHIIAQTNSQGVAEIPFIPCFDAQIGDYYVEAYGLDDRGRLVYAPDDSIHGSAIFPHVVQVTLPITRVKTVVFPAGEVVFSDVWNPKTPYAGITMDLHGWPTVLIPYAGHENPLAVTIKVYEHGTHGILDHYSCRFDPRFGLMAVFIEPGRRFESIVSFTGVKTVGMILLNGTFEKPEGCGYTVGKVGQQVVVKYPFVHYLEQILAISVKRYRSLSAQGIVMPVVTERLEVVNRLWNETVSALSARRYSKAYACAELGRAVAVDAYLELRKSYVDVVMSTVIVSLLLIPFLLLLLGIVPVKGAVSRIAVLALLSVVVFALMKLLHPGFNVIESLPALLTGVVVLTISIPALFIFLREAHRSLGEVRRRAMGVHRLEREVVDLAAVSFTTGVELLKKRKLRTGLILTLMIVIALALTSLTSVTPIFAVSPSATTGVKVPYAGVLLYSPTYNPLDDRLTAVVSYYAGTTPEKAVCYSWVYAPYTDAPIMVVHGNESTGIVAIMGVSPAFLERLMPWLPKDAVEEFNSTPFACILPSSIASQVGAKAGDSVSILGYKFKVVAVVDAAKLRKVKALDGSPVTPINKFELAELKTFQPNVRVAWVSLVIVPYKFVKNRGGHAVAVSIPIHSGVKSVARDLFYAFHGAVMVFAAEDNELLQYRGVNLYSTFGFTYMAIPITMAALIMTTTLIASAYERRKELSIYGVLGLPPLHTALVFFAECLTYAILGIVPGYLLGLAAAKLMQSAGIIPKTGFSLNVTSAATMSTLGLTLLLVLVAAVYPLYSITRMITPSLERRWKIPTKPKGDEWEIPLPFHVVSREEALGVLAFMQEFFEARRIERAGTFTTLDIRLEKREKEEYVVRVKVWLPPYELNLRQEALVIIYYSATEGKYMTDLQLRRISGPYDKWLTSNQAFVDAVRKQFLTWRLLRPEDKNRYYRVGASLFSSSGGEE